MFAVLLTIQIVVCIAMIGVILLQRSEGGGLGLGTGGGVSGLMTGRGAANALTPGAGVLDAATARELAEKVLVTTLTPL